MQEQDRVGHRDSRGTQVFPAPPRADAPDALSLSAGASHYPRARSSKVWLAGTRWHDHELAWRLSHDKSHAPSTSLSCIRLPCQPGGGRTGRQAQPRSQRASPPTRNPSWLYLRCEGGGQVIRARAVRHVHLRASRSSRTHTQKALLRRSRWRQPRVPLSLSRTARALRHGVWRALDAARGLNAFGPGVSKEYKSPPQLFEGISRIGRRLLYAVWTRPDLFEGSSKSNQFTVGLAKRRSSGEDPCCAGSRTFIAGHNPNP